MGHGFSRAWQPGNGCPHGLSAYRRGTGQCLWQTGYYDHVLRDEQSMQATAGYILQNPVRAGLVARMEQYPHMGSDRWAFSDLLPAVASRQNGGLPHRYQAARTA